jgi:adhesin transport system outer membrane protein
VAAPKTLEPAPDPTPSMPADKTLKNFDDSLRVNPSILSKQALIQAYEKGVLAAKGAFSPRFDFVAMTGTDRELPDRNYRDLQASSVSIQGHWNLYRGNSDVSRVRQVTAQQYAQRDLRDYTCRNVQQELAISWNSIANLRAQLPYLRDHAVATAKVREAYRHQFQIGQRTLLDLLDTENERFQATRALANAEYDMKLAQYRWLSLSHKLLPSLRLAQLDASDELPKEAAELELSEEVIKLCNSVAPDTRALTPIAVTYGEGDKPPTLTPSQGAPQRKGAKW